MSTPEGKLQQVTQVTTLSLYLIPEVSNTISEITIKHQSNIQIISFSRSAMSLMFFAAAMAALLVVVTLVRGLGTGTSGSLNRSHDSSIGHNC